ncbi:serine hydrolase domain-containing protein [Aridibaculum aurantiacum]|uniref:serine hydrolase domain-containing protein n=1 Tax=Aridibaculum aurantiacum TaxID=2810307 RepID=UPI001A95F656|nr:serine hydrolase domain-containing protein [Aridibaculum aurantiacum]
MKSSFLSLVLVGCTIFFSCSSSLSTSGNHRGTAGSGTIPSTLQATSPSAANVSEERLQRIDNIIQQAIEKREVAGAIGFIARNGKIVYNKSFGHADIPTQTALKTDHIFRIASQTKAITSVAVMMLFEEGKFLLDDRISKYIPAFAKPQVLDQYNAADTTFTTKPAKREITIRDLLTHTAGLQYAVIGGEPWTAIYSKAKIYAGFEASSDSLSWSVDRLAKLPLAHNPGEKFTYGLSTDVLGRLVEVASGLPLDRFFEERIFKPLGMTDTYFYLPQEKHSRLVTVHRQGANRTLTTYEGTGSVSADYPKRGGVYLSGGAGLSSTISDYAAFLQMLLNGGTYNGTRLLSRRSVELMTSNHIGDLFVGSDKFGLGFQVTTKQTELKLGMTEGAYKWGGYFGTTYWVDPKENIIALLYTQHSSLRSDVQDKFTASVYQVLND